MAQPVIKTSFASGEWAPKLQGRVDIQKYHAGAALMRNFFVDYSGGGASTRQGTDFINQCKTPGARLIPFQPSSNLSYVLEFGDQYIRFYSNGSPILEAPTFISGATQANPGVITDINHGYKTGDWIFISGIQGMLQLDNNFYIVVVINFNSYSLTDLNGVPVDTTLFSPFTAGGQAQRVYTITSPYFASELFPNPITGNQGLKFVQNVNTLIICHFNHRPHILTLLSPTNWQLTIPTFTPTIPTPTGVTVTSNLPAGTFSYGYVVTAVDANGQEASPSAVATISSLADIQIISTPGTNSITWTAVPGAASYNIYRTSATVTVPIAVGAQFGFIGNVTGTTFTETSPGINPDFSQGPPLPPPSGTGVVAVTLLTNGAYTVVPSVGISAPPSGVQATAIAFLGVTSVSPNTLIVTSQTKNGPAVSPNGGFVRLFGGGRAEIIGSTFISGIQYQITSLGITNGGSLSVPGTIAPTTFTPNTYDSEVKGLKINPVSGTVTLAWAINALTVTQGGSGYVAPPGVVFTPGPATGLSVLGMQSGAASFNPDAQGNPQAPGFLQQRLVLAGPIGAVQSYFMSQPGLYFNFDVSFPVQDSDAISGTIVSEDLNDIRNLVTVSTGLIAFTGKTAWLINGGGGVSVNNPITPANQTASPQAFSGANDLRPIKINYDILYGTNKGNYIRDLSFNIYTAIYTGSDISIFSNHLFFNHFLFDWAWSEEPFKTLWAIRDDGQLLSLAYVKEQELIGWAHHDTDGQFMSACSVIENVNGSIVDAVYLIVQRFINGNVVQYVERMADRFFPYGFEDAWSVDCGLQTAPAVTNLGTLTITGVVSAVGNSVTLIDTVDAPFTSVMASAGWVVRAGGGIYKITAFTSASQVTASVIRVPTLLDPYTGLAYQVTSLWTIWTPVTTVFGLTQLIGKTITGVADGAVVPPTVVSNVGSITLSAPASKITLGLAFTSQLKTLPLDLGEPTIQSKRKKLPALTLRVADTLGLQAGTSFVNALQFKDFIIGNLNIQSNGPVTDLFSGDGRMILDQYWQEPGQICVQQILPYPATILAVIPEVAVGDTK